MARPKSLRIRSAISNRCFSNTFTPLLTRKLVVGASLAPRAAGPSSAPTADHRGRRAQTPMACTRASNAFTLVIPLCFARYWLAVLGYHLLQVFGRYWIGWMQRSQRRCIPTSRPMGQSFEVTLGINEPNLGSLAGGNLTFSHRTLHL